MASPVLVRQRPDISSGTLDSSSAIGCTPCWTALRLPDTVHSAAMLLNPIRERRLQSSAAAARIQFVRKRNAPCYLSLHRRWDQSSMTRIRCASGWISDSSLKGHSRDAARSSAKNVTRTRPMPPRPRSQPDVDTPARPVTLTRRFAIGYADRALTTGHAHHRAHHVHRGHRPAERT